MENKALRYNSGKNRLSLVPTELIEGVAKVLTYGASKYTFTNSEGLVIDGANNWKKGLTWTSVIDSLERHLLAFKQGQDIDIESNCLHLEHAATNIAFLLNYYHTHPELDNRSHHTKRQPRISLDLDDVIVNFIESWCELHGQEVPSCWRFDRDMKSKIATLIQQNKLDDFFLGLKPKCNSEDIKFNPVAYVTARSVDTSICEQWLDKHKFPVAPVYNVGSGNSKLQILKELNVDIHVDDNYDTYCELNANGICCFLFDAKHNQQYNVGYRRIYSLKDLNF